eukprot:Nk52_evm8s1400 gene=Nk52_evmTU8s1400
MKIPTLTRRAQRYGLGVLLTVLVLLLAAVPTMVMGNGGGQKKEAPYVLVDAKTGAKRGVTVPEIVEAAVRGGGERPMLVDPDTGKAESFERVLSREDLVRFVAEQQKVMQEMGGGGRAGKEPQRVVSGSVENEDALGEENPRIGAFLKVGKSVLKSLTAKGLMGSGRYELIGLSLKEERGGNDEVGIWYTLRAPVEKSKKKNKNEEGETFLYEVLINTPGESSREAGKLQVTAIRRLSQGDGPGSEEGEVLEDIDISALIEEQWGLLEHVLWYRQRAIEYVSKGMKGLSDMFLPGPGHEEL